MTQYVNKVIPRIGAQDLARGLKSFSEDIPLKNALVLRVFRSTKAHAQILEIDRNKALQTPGVVGVLTAADIPGKKMHGLIHKDQPVLAQDKVRFVEKPLPSWLQKMGKPLKWPSTPSK